MKKYFLFLAIFIAFINQQNLFSEGGNAGCLEVDPCSNVDWNHETIGPLQTDLMWYMIKYKWRLCPDGTVQIQYEEDEFSLSGFIFRDDAYEHFDFSGKKQFIDYEILNHFVNHVNQGIGPFSQVSIPPCSTGALIHVSYYTARCGVYVKCSYKIDEQATVEKDIGYIGDCPSSFPHGGGQYINVYKWHSCGTICCKKSFSICFGYDDLAEREMYMITDITREPVDGDQCTEEGNFRDWKTNNIIPCYTGCEGDGN